MSIYFIFQKKKCDVEGCTDTSDAHRLGDQRGLKEQDPVYDICSSTVEAIEAKINKYTRKWPGVPPSHSDVAMYCRKAKLKLPMQSILEEYKCGKARLLTMLEESDDPVVKTVQPSLKTGRKWKVTEAVDEAKEFLKMKEVIGQTQTDRRGLGLTTAKWKKARKKGT
ncbi:reverse transcriptase [Plakobranchus ocellatus]|uniref:Reverse transcriptase n=1 Tax=Plakobranchus ocellatus TaxID=259542 RepID=A0AAV4D280_9GAST|nr:reverse transcriptase [Plakobranchus ocellatus]